mmetsp:Transcript_46043/g.80985  ORF Transcript_46043/g.80985 Transcript_46043/m.80985 type:complete len:350 (-) Transcript_46043:109-1158(-)
MLRTAFIGRAGIRAFCGGAVPHSGPKGYRAGELVPSLAALIPEIPGCKTIKPSELPWVKKSEAFFQTWQKLTPCMPKYEAFLKSHVMPGGVGAGLMHDMRTVRQKMQGQAMTEVSTVALGEFYLAVALQLRPGEIDAAGSDSEALLKVARSCAEDDFEPCIEQARELIADYSPSLHQALEETCPLYEVDDGLFWRANFDVVAPAEFHHFLTALGHGSGQGFTVDRAHTSPKDVERTIAQAKEALVSDDPSMEPARRAGEIVYSKWLEASSMPVKATVAKALMEHGFMVAIDIYQGDKLLPESAEVASMIPRPLSAAVSVEEAAAPISEETAAPGRAGTPKKSLFPSQFQ